MNFQSSGHKCKVLVVLVNWRRALDTCLCIDSLRRISGVELTLAICENGSADGSAEIIRKHLCADYSESILEGATSPDDSVTYVYRSLASNANKDAPSIAHLVVSQINRGFAGGNNVALMSMAQESATNYVWFLNNDTEVATDTLELMVSHMDSDPNIGICGATLIFAHDRKTVQAFGGAEYSPWFGAISEIGQGSSWPCSVDQSQVEQRMHYVSGASMLVSAAFIEKVGLMSEDYFLYYEEIDWAERARRAGFRLGYASKAVVYHKEGAALGSGRSEQRSALAEYYGVRNRLVVTKKFFPWALPTVLIFSWLQVFKRLSQGRWARARLMAAILLGLQRTPPSR